MSSDNVQCLLVAKAVQSGNVLLHGWTLASDNFLFTDVPTTLAVSLIITDWRTVIIVVPFVTYIAIMLLSALIVYLETKRGAKSAASIILLACLLFAPNRVGYGRFVLVGAQHESTIALALLATLMIQCAYKGRQRSLALTLFGVISTVIAFSDPFGVIFFSLPAMLFFSLNLLKGIARPSKSLLIISTASLLSGRVLARCVTALGGFDTGLTYDPHLVAWSELGKSLFGLVSGLLSLTGADVFRSRTTLMLAVAIHFLLFCATVFAIGRTVVRQKPSVSTLIAWCALIDVLACAGSAQFAYAVGSSTEDGGDARRYLAPAVIFGSMLISIELPKWLKSTQRIALIAAAAFGLAVATCHNLYTWPLKSALSSEPQAQIADWLEQHDLHQGFASYWNASLITVLSRDRVKVRAIESDGHSLVPFYWLADRDWYHGQKPEFVIYNKINSFGLNVPLIEHTYGKPTSTVSMAGVSIAIFGVLKDSSSQLE